MEQPQPTSSRSSFSEAGAIQGPTPVFDIHLRYLSDSYLAFFQERKRIEEVYVDSLKRLHRKIRSVDAQLDERGDLSTARSAWGEVVDNVERDRTRKRIKEDIKDSTAAYSEYAETVLPKLKGRYAKKFSDVEEQRRANAPPLSTSPPQTDPNAYLNNPKLNPAGPSRPSVTGPQPLRPLDRRPSGSAPSARNRSPSGTTPFSDLAHHGKKQLNQIIGGLLDKRGVPDGLGSRENQAFRNARAKREAEDADKEYRKGVHWLETLRLRRTKILENGYKSLETLIVESSTVLKRSLERYSDNMTATWTTQTQLSSHVRTFVDKISPEKDLAKVQSVIPRSLASAIPDPILYEHGQVGACSDLIFGFSLVDYATSKGLQEGEIPKILRICIEEIDKRGLENEGIYRVSGRHAVVQALQHDVEKDEADFEFTPKDDIYAVASLLKLYLRELPEPVFRFPLQDPEHQANNFILLRSKIRRLPIVHQAVLKALLEHLGRVVAHSEKNKMDPKNLAIVFGSVIFGEDEMPKGGDLLSVQTYKDTLMEDLIIHYRKIFDEPAAHSSPPLPPTPATEPIPQYYGSKNTLVATVPPLPEVHDQGSPQDFTPRLPPRPKSPQKPRPDSQLPPLPADNEEEEDEDDDDDDDYLSSSPSPTTAKALSQSDANDALHSRKSTEDTNTSQESNRPATPSSKLYPFPGTSAPDSPPANANANANSNNSNPGNANANGAGDPPR
ncbi:hypothetical protein EST38_g2011 [Candolleomyces aberdarensis]|uniref:Rho-GAP domain-containing protein n=1 Tax=Candolleomyces aberdarensis TaxID=2316362 RepID=A0A4Q2DW35_9AGAR|nr:hypothetical protein EST38_g2011 [Candolleomyces aberdarensis]